MPLGGAAVWVLNTETKEEKKSVSPKKVSTQDMVEGVRSFLSYLASREVQAKWHMKTAYVPVSKSVKKDLKEFYEDHPYIKPLSIKR